MQPLIVLEDPLSAVQPGAETRLPIRIHNPGTIVESYKLDVVGLAAAWTTVEPAVVSVYPGQEAEAEVVFQPPRATTTPLGLVPFGVRAVSDVDPGRSAVTEGELEVGGIVELTTTLLPRNSKGRWKGKHRLEIENMGNSPVSLALGGSDPDEQLDIRIKPATVEVQAGDFAVAKIKAKIRAPFLRGPATPRMFKIAVTELPSDEVSQRRIARGEGHQQDVDGVVGQRQIIGGSFMGLAAVLALAVAGFFAFSSLQADNGPAGDDGSAEAVPKPPEGLSASALDTEQIRLSWAAPTADEQGFDILRLVDGGTQTVQTDLPRGDTTFDVDALEPETEYCFALRSFNDVGRSDPSPSVCTTTGALEQPTAPGSVRIEVSDDGAGERITIGWVDLTDNGADTTVIENDTPIATVPAGRSTIELGRPEGEYCYEIRSVVNGVRSVPGVDATGQGRICVDVQPPAEAVEGGTTGYFIQVDGPVRVPDEPEDEAQDDRMRSSFDNIESRRQNWVDDGHSSAVVVLSTHVGLTGDPSWFVIIPGFASEDAADQYCEDEAIPRSQCLVRPPGG